MASLLEENKARGMLRTITPKKQQGSRIFIDGKEYINLSSNDYLGLGQDAALAKEFLDYSTGHVCPLSSSGSPLLTGAHESYAQAEEIMERLFSKKAVFFNSGFSANSGILAALGDKHTLIIADKLAHASMIDGILASKGRYLRYAHNDYEHLEELISKNHAEYESVIIVTEAIFSMDGDRCDLKRLVDLKKRYPNVYLYVDEAHSFTLFNENGAGLCVNSGLGDQVDFILTTFGKGLGSEGACILCNATARSYLINTARSLIFSTALSPFSFAHTAFMLNHMQKRNDLRKRLAGISTYIHKTLTESGFENLSDSQIIPLLTFENQASLEAAAFFRENGFYAMPIRHPTVPKGKARLRLSLSAALTDSEVEKLALTIRKFAQSF